DIFLLHYSRELLRQEISDAGIWQLWIWQSRKVLVIVENLLFRLQKNAPFKHTFHSSQTRGGLPPFFFTMKLVEFFIFYVMLDTN
ncbi:MAG: hypothetical protein ACE5HS_21455, partial [bacterium]